ncbi:MAG: hypothetical protein KatS3mg108_1663 [Isosphaeraceae bacterium]|jgi:hypothetical protein|nr:MAG: hypothetical protein KatS3mg108_1663 [Isosphaeraceae bacterium]
MHALAWLWVSLIVVQGDAAELVRRLGATRFSDREAAYEQLDRMGSAALAALRSAADSPDAEVRARALDLIQRIEARTLVEPTQVRLDFVDRPLTEVLEALGERARVQLQSPLANANQAAQRRITLEAPQPVPFWTAVERLCEAAELDVLGQPVALASTGRSSSLPIVQLLPRTGPPAPSFVSGPFRFTAFHVSHHRDRSFTYRSFGGGPFPHLNRAQARLLTRPNDSAPGQTTEAFSLSVQIQAEPRLSISQAGSCVVLEARDEQGRSLKPEAADPDNPRQIVQAGFGPGVSVFVVTIPLVLPDDPGRLIRELRAEVPVLISARRDQPFEIGLREAKGKTFEDPHVTLTIHDVRPEPMNAATLIELTVRFRRDDESTLQGLPFGSPEFQAFRNNPGTSGGPVEFVDSQGRLLSQWQPIAQEPAPDGLRLTIRVLAGEAGASPAALRIYEQIRGETVVPIHLRDIPLP